MQTKKLHSWNLSYAQARNLQKQLASKVQFRPFERRATSDELRIAGLDCAFSKDGQRIVAAAVVLTSCPICRAPSGERRGHSAELSRSPTSFEIIETTSAVRKVNFPYIPGLLSFREAPACIAAVEKLKTEPDLFLIDGQGIAHPRRLGLAAHLGLFFDKPTIGCAKSRLTGTFTDPPLEKGTYTFLKDKPLHASRFTNNEIIGAVVRTRTNVKPLFVSVGNKCLLRNAIQITLRCATKCRLPEPTRLAHQMVSKLRLPA